MMNAELMNAELNLELLQVKNDNAYVRFELNVKNEALEDILEDMRVVKKRAQQEKKTALLDQRAHFKHRMNRAKEEHATLAELLMNNQIEKVLKDLGAEEALAQFRSTREERRREVDRVYQIDEDYEEKDARRFERANEYDHKVYAKTKRDKERKDRRSAKRRETWDKLFEKYTATRDANAVERVYHQQIVEEMDRMLESYRTTVPADNSPPRVTSPAHPIWAPAADGTTDVYDRESPLSPVPEQEFEGIKEEKTIVVDEKYERHLWEKHCQYELETTEVDVEVDIPIFGEAQATYHRTTNYRRFDPDREVDQPEQMGYIVISPQSVTVLHQQAEDRAIKQVEQPDR